MPHSELEIAIVLWVASLGGQYWFLDRLTVQMVSNATFRALPCVALLAGYWAGDDLKRRIVLAGFLGGGGALVVSRLIQNAWASPRPIHDASLSGLFRPEFQDLIGHDYHSFPSDHAALLVPLVWAVSRLQPRLGAATTVLLATGLAARVYLGLHFPTDVLGGLVLGALAVVVVETSPRPVDRTLALAGTAQRRWPIATAGVLFVIAYGYASMFGDFRELANSVMRALSSF